MLTAVTGARILDPGSSLDEVGDLVIENGRFRQIGRDAWQDFCRANNLDSTSVQSARVIDARGRWVCPGFVDLHVHLREPGHEYKETIASGLAAAAAGGFTTVCAMPNTAPINDTRAVTESMLQQARMAKGARLHVFGAVTVGSKGSELTEMGDLREAGAMGVSDDGVCVMNAAVMRRAMEYANTFDLLVSQHAEDHDLTAGAQMHEGAISTRLGLQGWPREAEDIIVARDLLLAERTGARYHVAHISSLGAVRLIREAKARGLRVSAEVTPHHLCFTHEALLGYNTACKVNPPLRTEEDQTALIDALADGTIDCVATDHAPHSALEKDCEFEAASPGIVGLETALAALLGLVRDGRLPLQRLIESLTSAPAKIGKLESVGSIRAGGVADLVVIDPERSWTVDAVRQQSRSANTPWDQQTLQGRPLMTLVNGEVVHEKP